MVATVKLFPKELKWCQQHAENIVNHYGGEGSKGSGAYNHNKISSNLVGVKSEKATAVYLKRFIPKEDIMEHYIDFTNKTNKLISSKRIRNKHATPSFALNRSI